MDEIKQSIEDAKQELALLQAEIDTLKARKSIIQCIREDFSQEPAVSVLKRKVYHKFGCKEPPKTAVTIWEHDFEQLARQAHSSAWLEMKISELKRLGDRLWYQLNQKELLKAAIQRAEEAEIRCRSLEQELFQSMADRIQTDYDQDEGADREIDYPDWDDREY